MPSLAKSLFRRLPVARSTRAYSFALSHLSLPPSARLLDIGSGQGYGSAFLSRAFPEARVFGTDISFECQEGAHPQYGARLPHYIQANAPFFPIKDNSLDAVFIIMTFHCLPQPERVISEIARTLCPGGTLILADVNGSHWMARPFEWFEHLFIGPLTRAWRADELRALAEKDGLTEIRIHHRPGKENGFMQWLIARK
jgi:ubiquinone/menaquinone biosynthesis C-methylase UbiE